MSETDDDASDTLDRLLDTCAIADTDETGAGEDGVKLGDDAGAKLEDDPAEETVTEDEAGRALDSELGRLLSELGALDVTLLNTLELGKLFTLLLGTLEITTVLGVLTALDDDANEKPLDAPLLDGSDDGTDETALDVNGELDGELGTLLRLDTLGMLLETITLTLDSGELTLKRLLTTGELTVTLDTALSEETPEDELLGLLNEIAGLSELTTLEETAATPGDETPLGDELLGEDKISDDEGTAGPADDTPDDTGELTREEDETLLMELLLDEEEGGTYATITPAHVIRTWFAAFWSTAPTSSGTSSAAVVHAAPVAGSVS